MRVVCVNCGRAIDETDIRYSDISGEPGCNNCIDEVENDDMDEMLGDDW